MTEYHVIANLEEASTGPFTFSEVGELVKTKVIHKSSLVWFDGNENNGWNPIMLSTLFEPLFKQPAEPAAPTRRYNGNSNNSGA